MNRHRYRNTLRRLLPAAALVLLLIGCSTPGPPVRNFLLPEGRQYFLRPVEMSGERGTLLFDLTVRTVDEEGSDEAVGSASANFTAPLFDPEDREIEEAYFELGSGRRILLENLRFLFVGEGSVRYESTIPYEDALLLVDSAAEEDELIRLNIRRGGEIESYRGGRRFYESMAQLHLRL